MVDMAPELLQQIQSDWSDNLKNDAEIKSLIEKINKGKATYKEVEDLSYRVGKDLSKSLLDNITEDILPNGHVPQNVAEKILHPTLNNAHNLVTNVAVKVQEDMNEAAGIGLKAQKTDYNEEKVQGLVHKLTNGQFEDTKWILDEPVTLFVQSVADNTLKKNVDFQAHSGLKPQIIRKASSNCCSWCSDLEGTYDYGSEPKDVYRRHERCKCSVDYNPGNGKRQDVWSKEWHEDADKEKIQERIELNRSLLENKQIYPKFDVKTMPEAKYSETEIYTIAYETEKILLKHLDIESEWSGKFKFNNKDNIYYKDWDCDIMTSYKTAPFTIMHEQIHARSISKCGENGEKIYFYYRMEEESAVNLLAQEIAKKEGLKIIPSVYDKSSDALRKINEHFKISPTNYDFAKKLIEYPPQERKDWVLNSIKDRNLDKRLELEKLWREVLKDEDS